MLITAPSAGGVRAASCSPLNPLHDVPTMPTLPVAPGLRGEPRDDLETVQLLLLGVLVLDDPAGVAGAADVDADAAVAVAGEPAHLLVVARLRPVAQPVGQVFEDRRHAAGALRQPEPRRQTACRRRA